MVYSLELQTHTHTCIPTHIQALIITVEPCMAPLYMADQHKLRELSPSSFFGPVIFDQNQKNWTIDVN